MEFKFDEGRLLQKGGGFFYTFVKTDKTNEVMAISFEEYTRANSWLNEMIDSVNDEIPQNDPLMVEFLKISKTIETYEREYFPIG